MSQNRELSEWEPVHNNGPSVWKKAVAIIAVVATVGGSLAAAIALALHG